MSRYGGHIYSVLLFLKMAPRAKGRKYRIIVRAYDDSTFLQSFISAWPFAIKSFFVPGQWTVIGTTGLNLRYACTILRRSGQNNAVFLTSRFYIFLNWMNFFCRISDENVLTDICPTFILHRRNNERNFITGGQYWYTSCSAKLKKTELIKLLHKYFSAT